MSGGGILDRSAARAFAGQRVLITGASGFVGGHFARQAELAGVSAVTIGRNPSKADLPFRSANLTDPVALMKSVRMVEPELIVHFASPGVTHGTASFDETLHALVTGGKALLTAASELPTPPHFIQIGSGLEYSPQARPIREDDSISPSSSAYGAAKAAAAALLSGFADRLPITLLRPFNLHGSGDLSPRLGNTIVDRALAAQPIALTAGEQVRDFLHVDDFCRLVWTLATGPMPTGGVRVLNAGSGEQRTVRAYVEALVATLADYGVAAQVKFGELDYRPGEPMIAVPDLARLYAATPWRPKIEFATAVGEFVRWKLTPCR